MSNHFFPMLSIISILIIYLSFAVLFYVAQTKLEMIEKCLDKCSWVNNTAHVWGRAGVIGKIHRLSIIYVAMLLPRFLKKKKAIDLMQIISIPKNLKRWVQIPITIMLIATAIPVVLSPWFLF